MARLTQTQAGCVAVRMGWLTDIASVVRVANMGKVARMVKANSWWVSK